MVLWIPRIFFIVEVLACLHFSSDKGRNHVMSTSGRKSNFSNCHRLSPSESFMSIFYGSWEIKTVAKLLDHLTAIKKPRFRKRFCSLSTKRVLYITPSDLLRDPVLLKTQCRKVVTWFSRSIRCKAFIFMVIKKGGVVVGQQSIFLPHLRIQAPFLLWGKMG